MIVPLNLGHVSIHIYQLMLHSYNLLSEILNNKDQNLWFTGYTVPPIIPSQNDQNILKTIIEYKIDEIVWQNYPKPILNWNDSNKIHTDITLPFSRELFTDFINLKI